MKKILHGVLMTALVLTLGGCTPSFRSSMTITALLPDSAGLFVGNDVGILGVPVGKVEKIVPDGDKVKVVVSVDAGTKIPADAGAVVVARSVATDRYLEMTPVYRSGALMRTGTVIPMERTRTPVDFDEVLAALNTFSTDLAGSGATRNAIKRLLAAGSRAVGGRGDEVNRAISALGAAVDAISAQRGNITGSVKSLDVLMAAIAQNQQVVREFIDKVSSASTFLAEERGNLRAAIESLSKAVRLVADFAGTRRQDIKTTLDSSARLMRTIMSERAGLTEGLEVMPLALENLSRVLYGDRLLVRMDPTILTPLTGLVDNLCTNPVAELLCTSLGPGLLNLTNLLQLLGLGGAR